MNKKKLIRMVSVYSVIYTAITLLNISNKLLMYERNISNKLLMYESEIHPLHKLRLCNGYSALIWQ